MVFLKFFEYHENLVSVMIPSSFTDAKYPIDIKLSTYQKKKILWLVGIAVMFFDKFLYQLPIGLKILIVSLKKKIIFLSH